MQEVQLFSLLAHFEGLSVANPVDLASLHGPSDFSALLYIVNAILDHNGLMGWVKACLSLGWHCYVCVAVILSGGAWEMWMALLCQMQLLISSFNCSVFVCLFLFCFMVPDPVLSP